MNNDRTQWTKIGLIEDRIKETQDPKFIHLFINELAKKKLLTDQILHSIAESCDTIEERKFLDAWNLLHELAGKEKL